ncbi:MAG: NYN domain-containing protein [Nocardioidaceae bacterium]|nr:NYN domain-containing protein [Nocardioidaceae bacterium]
MSPIVPVEPPSDSRKRAQPMPTRAAPCRVGIGRHFQAGCRPMPMRTVGPTRHPAGQPPERNPVMKKSASINFRAAAGRPRHAKTRTHRLPICAETGLVRYRDRHQARDGVKVLATAGTRASTFACHACSGFHTDVSEATQPAPSGPVAAPVDYFQTSMPSRRRRYFLIDLENPTRGAKATSDEVAKLWRLLKEQAPGIAPEDHVVVGTSRAVAGRYRPVVSGENVKWVVGANAKDGADRALLAAIDVHSVGRRYDELVIFSGDNAFTPLAVSAKRLGLRVHVITAEHPSGRSMLSSALSDAADIHTVIRLRGKSQRRQAVSAARAMSATWRLENHTLAA